MIWFLGEPWCLIYRVLGVQESSMLVVVRANVLPGRVVVLPLFMMLRVGLFALMFLNFDAMRIVAL